MVPGTYNGCAFRLVKYEGLQNVWSHANKNTLIHVRASVEPNEKGLMLDTEGSSRWGYHSYNATPGGADAAVFLGMINSFAHNTKVTAGIELAVQRHYAVGSIYNPDYEFTSNANLWAQTVALNSIGFNAVSRATFSRGYMEEAFTIDGNWGAFQGAGTTADIVAAAAPPSKPQAVISHATASVRSVRLWLYDVENYSSPTASKFSTSYNHNQ